MISVRPGTSYEATLELGISGLVGTLEVGTYDGDTATQALTTAGINEIGTSGVYVATLTSPDDRGQYVLIWSQDGTLDPDQVATEDLRVTSSTGDPFDGETYCDVDELFRVLKILTPTDEQTEAGEDCLAAATFEIDREIDLEDDEVLSGAQVALARRVCLSRAVELWQEGGSPWGLIGLGAETGVAFASADSWKRHALKLAPLKARWGFA